jgi:hypothetical protein
MSTAPVVILITVAGPAGHVDVGVRSDATPQELAASLAPVLGTGPAWPGGEHRAPPRPGAPKGYRGPLRPDSPLSEAGVVDGDLVIFGRPGGQPGGDGLPLSGRIAASLQRGNTL